MFGHFKVCFCLGLVSYCLPTVILTILLFIFISRHLVRLYQRNCPPSDDIQLVKFLLRIIGGSHAELISSTDSISSNRNCSAQIRRSVPHYSCLWEVQTVAFTMLGEAISRVGPSFPPDLWKSTVEVEICYPYSSYMCLRMHAYVHLCV